MENTHYLLIDSKILPPVFEKVLLAKELLASGEVTSAAMAAKRAGISRSAFYKYKNFVFKYAYDGGNTVNLNATLSDRAGVFSALTTALYDCGANIVTVSQGLPENGKANVSLTVKTEKDADDILEMLSGVDGVISIKKIEGVKK